MTAKSKYLHCPKRIVITGGPGGGKTTASDLLRRELGDRVVIVPESATLLYTGGLPRVEDTYIKKITQNTIFQLQVNNEQIHSHQYPDRFLICDRGTIDGAAYWPGPTEEFFNEQKTNLSDELNRYQAVIFFETAAAGGFNIESENTVRNENLEQAKVLDQKLQELWHKHPNFHFIPNELSFVKKILNGLQVIDKVFNQINK